MTQRPPTDWLTTISRRLVVAMTWPLERSQNDSQMEPNGRLRRNKIRIAAGDSVGQVVDDHWSMVRTALPEDVPSVLALWDREARAGNADSPWPSADVRQIGFTLPNHLHVVVRDSAISGAVLVRPSFYVTREYVERLEPFIAADREAESEVLHWLTNRPSPLDAQSSMDLWRVCGSEGLAPDFGFVHVRTFLRMDRADLSDVTPSPLPADIELIGADDPRANMGGWAQLYNEAFAGEWRQNALNAMQMYGFVAFGGGQHSMAAIDRSGATAGLALARLENRPHDHLLQPTANVWVLCVAAGRRRERIGAGLLNEVLIRLRSVGALSATIQADPSSWHRSFQLYERLGFIEVRRFCVWNRPM